MDKLMEKTEDIVELAKTLRRCEKQEVSVQNNNSITIMLEPMSSEFRDDLRRAFNEERGRIIEKLDQLIK